MSLSKLFYKDYINNNLNQWTTISADLEETSKSDSLEKNKKLLTRVTECISRISRTSSSEALRKDPRIIGRILSQAQDTDIRDKAMMALDRTGRITFFSFILRLERIQSSQPPSFQIKHAQEEKEELENEEVHELEEIFSFDEEKLTRNYQSQNRDLLTITLATSEAIQMTSLNKTLKTGILMRRI